MCAHFLVGIQRISNILSIRNNTKSCVSAWISQKEQSFLEFQSQIIALHHVPSQPHNLEPKISSLVPFPFSSTSSNQVINIVIQVGKWTFKDTTQIRIRGIRIPRFWGVTYNKEEFQRFGFVVFFCLHVFGCCFEGFFFEGGGRRGPLFMAKMKDLYV